MAATLKSTVASGVFELGSTTTSGDIIVDRIGPFKIGTTFYVLAAIYSSGSYALRMYRASSVTGSWTASSDQALGGTVADTHLFSISADTDGTDIIVGCNASSTWVTGPPPEGNSESSGRRDYFRYNTSGDTWTTLRQEGVSRYLSRCSVVATPQEAGSPHCDVYVVEGKNSYFFMGTGYGRPSGRRYLSDGTFDVGEIELTASTLQDDIHLASSIDEGDDGNVHGLFRVGTGWEHWQWDPSSASPTVTTDALTITERRDYAMVSYSGTGEIHELLSAHGGSSNDHISYGGTAADSNSVTMTGVDGDPPQTSIYRVFHRPRHMMVVDPTHTNKVYALVNDGTAMVLLSRSTNSPSSSWTLEDTSAASTHDWEEYSLGIISRDSETFLDAVVVDSSGNIEYYELKQLTSAATNKNATDTDQVIASEATSVRKVVSDTDQVVGTDSAASLTRTGLSDTDQVSVTETTSVEKLVSDTDQVSVTDNAAVSVSITASDSDQVVATEAAAADRLLTDSDQVAVTETTSVEKLVSDTDQLVAVESAAADRILSDSDQVAATETLVLDRAIGDSDQLSVTEAASADRLLSDTDQLVATDTVVAVEKLVSDTDQLVAVDSAGLLAEKLASDTDQISVTEATSVEKLVSDTDQVVASDLVSVLDRTVSDSDQVVGSDSTQLLDRTVSDTDQVLVTDSAVVDTGGVTNKNATDTDQVSATEATSVEKLVSDTDQVSVTEATSVEKLVSDTDQVSATEAVLAEKLVSDTDQVAGSDLTSILDRAIADLSQIFLTDTAAAVRSLADTDQVVAQDVVSQIVKSVFDTDQIAGDSATVSYFFLADTDQITGDSATVSYFFLTDTDQITGDSATVSYFFLTDTDQITGDSGVISYLFLADTDQVFGDSLLDFFFYTQDQDQIFVTESHNNPGGIETWLPITIPPSRHRPPRHQLVDYTRPMF